MADLNQFGSARPGFGPDCQRCERQLTDAIDGTLTADEQAVFDQHITICAECQHMLAEAKRGLAWLELLQADQPEPAADLVDRILRQTSGSPSAIASTAGFAPGSLPLVAAPDGTIAFPHPVAARRPTFGALLQTRFAMTAAMAFFSVALTLNLTGVRLSEIRPGDLTPSALRREAFALNAYVFRYYESLRVVYELESRVHDIQHANDTVSPATVPPASASPATGQPSTAPANPTTAPAKSSGSAPQPDDKEPAATRPRAPSSAESNSGNKHSFLIPLTSPGPVTPVAFPLTLPTRQKGNRI